MFKVGDKVVQKTHLYPYLGIERSQVGTVAEVTKGAFDDVVDVMFSGMDYVFPFLAGELEIVNDHPCS